MAPGKGNFGFAAQHQKKNQPKNGDQLLGATLSQSLVQILRNQVPYVSSGQENASLMGFPDHYGSDAKRFGQGVQSAFLQKRLRTQFDFGYVYKGSR